MAKQFRRLCAFCHEARKLSQEHLFSQWMHDHLPDSDTMTMSRTRATDKRELLFVRHRQGSAKKATIGGLCAVCNNGWMSELEQSVKPILKSMFTGQKLNLDVEQQLSLRNFMMMKAFVADSVNREWPIFSDDEFFQFYTDRAVPEDTTIIVMAMPHDGEGFVKPYNKETNPYTLEGEEERRYMGNITFWFNAVFVQVLRAPSEKGPPPGDRSYEIHLWPASNEVVSWPPAKTIGVRNAQFFQQWLEFLISGKVDPGNFPNGLAPEQ